MADTLYVAPDSRLDRSRLADFVALADRLAATLGDLANIAHDDEARDLVSEYRAFVVDQDRIYSEYVEEGGGQ